MNKLVITLLSVSILISSCHAQPDAKAFESIAVVELFTSEGCSSCPPADKLLAKYEQLGTYQGVKIFPIAFHVDYWNYLGWKDSFSSADNSDRQRMYVDALGLSGAYTPQMIVNGTAQFVGSDESALQAALTAASKKKNSVAFTQLNAANDHGTLKVLYTLQGDIKDCEIHVALVSPEVSTAVKRGENIGRKLTHTNVVRQFTSEKAKSSGEVAFQNTGTDHTAVIAYVQRIADHSIIAAVKIKP